MAAWADEAHVLAVQLGVDHDLAVLAAVLTGEGPDLLGADRARRARRPSRTVGQTCSPASAPAAGRIYAEKPKAFTRRIAAWWSD